MRELLDKSDMHKYQVFSTEFILKHMEAALLLDCGCGKTVITLTAIDELLRTGKARKVLVICPIRVALVWENEVRKWKHLIHLRVSRAVGTVKERTEALKRDADIYVINRENIPWLVEKSGILFDYDMVVVDELSSFKNWNAKRFKALMMVRPKICRIVGLTGTPSPNGLMDLFAEYKLLDQGKRLGRYIAGYRARYFLPDKCNGSIVYSYKPRTGADRQIYQAIEDMTISMKGTDHLDMPTLINSEYPVYLDEDEMGAYEEMRETLSLRVGDGVISSYNAAVLSGKLTQFANGAVYNDSGKALVIHSRKLDALEDIIEAACGKSVLVAYWFRHDLCRIMERLDSLGIRYAILDSDETIRQWNAGELEVGLIHPAAAGHGLNLQSGGSTLVWYGMIWSLEFYRQTVARLWRQGQKSGTVVVQHIVAKDTIDEIILRALTRKDATQKALIEAVKAEVV